MSALKWVGRLLAGLVLGGGCGYASGCFYVTKVEPPHSGTMADGAVVLFFTAAGAFAGPILAVLAVRKLRSRRARVPDWARL